MERRRALEASIPPPEPATTAVLPEYVETRARRLAEIDWAPYRPGPADARERLADLTYEDYRSIGFRPEAALWRDEARFELQLAHPGFLYAVPVRIHVVDDGDVADVPFDPTRFRYGRGLEWAAELAAATPATGHAGFRVYYPLESTPDDPSGGDPCEGCTREVAVFLGASYFRLLGKDQVHGLSARGLAVDVASPGGEEFPVFREFWLVRPDSGARALTVLALLDSPSVTGAFRFVLRPGTETRMDVDARIFARADVGKLGVAPLTSMYLHGPAGAARFDDYRPRVHDSDGLLAWTGRGEWIWRPLANGPGLRVTSLRDRAPRGFGLVQRHREFADYLDLEALYHLRPSLWVEVVDGPGPDGGWGGGGVELVEIPAPSEFQDNVVASWVPDEPFEAGTERRYRYRLATFGRRLDRQTLLQVERTRSGWDALPGEADPPPRSRRRFVVDFGTGGAEAAVPAEVPRAVVETTSGAVSDVVVQRLPGGGWRAAFDLLPDGGRRADLRLWLSVDGEAVSETWSYLWDPATVAS